MCVFFFVNFELPLQHILSVNTQHESKLCSRLQTGQQSFVSCVMSVLRVF
jgi:hypothetical protein